MNYQTQVTSPVSVIIVSSLGTTSRGGSSTSALCPEDNHTDEGAIIVNTALLACIEALQAANKHLQDVIDKQGPKCFRLENIKHSDKLVLFYTEFQSYETLLAFYEFLRPSVDNLKYWGSKLVKAKS